jgi:hypothetical protein
MRLAAVSLVALAAACGKDSKFVDAGMHDGAPVDGGGDAPGLDVPASLDLGEVACGASFEGSATIENTGGVDLTFAIASSNPVFAVAPAEGMLGAGDEIALTLTATVPTGAAAGTPLAGELTITTDQLDPIVIPIAVTPRGGVLVVDPVPVSFGDVEVGLSGAVEVTVSNQGNQPITVEFLVPADTDFGFDLTEVDLAVEQQVTGTATYTPTELGAASGNVAVVVTGVTCGVPPELLPMSGNGAPDGGVLVNGNVAFGSQACTSATEDTREVTLTNDGNVTATFTAAMLVDDEGDHLRYTVSPDSGSIPPGDSATVTVTRVPPSLPFQPREVNATLRIHTAGQLEQDHDLPATQTIDGPYLEASVASLDFGYAPVGETLSHTVTISNSGTAGSTLTYTETGAGFEVPQNGATIGPGPSQVSFTASYAPEAPGTTSGNVAVAASPASCSGPVAIALDGGDGPWAVIDDGNVAFTCTMTQQLAGASGVYVQNQGTQPLVVSGCVETSSTDVDPTLTPDPATVQPGTQEFLFLGWSHPSPLRSGTTTAAVQCDTNEKYYTQRSLLVVRTIYGADLVLEPADGDFAFTCTMPIDTEKRLRITNSGNQDAYLTRDTALPTPLYPLGSAWINVASSGGVTTDFGVGKGSGSCAPGSGYIGVGTGSGAICSIEPSTRLNVTLSN